MSCQVEQIGDCGDIATLGRSLFITDRDDQNWLAHCVVSLSSCGGLLAVAHKNRLCLLTIQWISSSEANSYIISWSGTLGIDITALLVVPICPTSHSQSGPDWFCIMVGFKNGSVGFFTNTGHQLINEKLDEKPILKISCHTGTYGTLPDDIYVLTQTSECIINGSNLFQTLRFAKAQLARVQAGVQQEYSLDGRNVNIRKWSFSDQDVMSDATVVGLELKNTYDHLLAASSYGGYDTWYRSIPPHNTLILGTGNRPYLGFHYALEGGTSPPLQDVARAVASKIKSALPGWLGGGLSENPSTSSEPKIRPESLSMRSGVYDPQRQGSKIALSPDRSLAAIADNLGRVAILDVNKGFVLRLFKGYRDAQCGFIQVFEEDNKKRQLSTIKDLRRALFLVIYNPKKGLIDIRLMQRGHRVAVFTATKNGTLIYNCNGLVGAEQSYMQKKLNLPEYQCVLMDPDGKLKKFLIPFFFALEGEHSDRSKDLHILRDLRDYIKKSSNRCPDFSDIILSKALELKTVDLKKHCLEMLIRNYEVAPNIVMSCLDVFMKSVQDIELDALGEKCMIYFVNLALATVLYRRINGDSCNDMVDVLNNINVSKHIRRKEYNDESEALTFHLLETDNEILKRLLALADKKDYKEHHHLRVTFADNVTNNYKEFISSFDLEQENDYLTIKPDLSQDKLNVLSGNIFKLMLKVEDFKHLSGYVLESNVEPKAMVKLIITHLMNTSIEDLSIELIDKVISIIYYLSRVSEQASMIMYNEISLWWQSVRDIIIDMPCPLRSMIVAMACRVVVSLFEHRQSSNEDEWESVTKENAKWSILIGKLEDISILSIILLFKETFKGQPLPKLPMSVLDINLKFIYSRGKGSVSELISKWLCGMGVIPEAIILNEILERQMSEDDIVDDDAQDALLLEDKRYFIEDNKVIFTWFDLLRKQFPYSTTADVIITNMSWEYAVAWHKNMNETDKLMAVIHCLSKIKDAHIKLGLCSIIWSTYIKQTFELCCRLINKVGKLPKERLCAQDVGLTDKNMIKFLDIVTKYLNCSLQCINDIENTKKTELQFEKIWDSNTPSLVEVAQDTKNFNCSILNICYQMCCTLHYQCQFNLKLGKPLHTLYDIDLQHVFSATNNGDDTNDIIIRASDSKLKGPRIKFLSKGMLAALELISCEENDDKNEKYNTTESLIWIEKLYILSELWHIQTDYLTRQQVYGLYHLGYDTLSEELLPRVINIEELLHPLILVASRRLKRSLEISQQPAEWLAALPPNLITHLNSVESDSTISANISLKTTASVIRNCLWRIDDSAASNKTNIRLAELIVKGCEILEQIS